MRVGNTDSRYQDSSFLSIEKDTALIIQKIMEDNELKKLLFYNTKDCLSKPELNQEQTYSLINKQIKIIPKLPIESKEFACVAISFDSYTPNMTNPQFRDSVVSFDIFCPYSIWDLGDFKQRPYKIAGRIDARLNNQKLTGIGTLQFLGSNYINVNKDVGVITLMYSAIHGTDDKIE